MAYMKIRTERDERHDARKAVAEARRARTESKKLAKTMKGENRARLVTMTASARALTRTARAELGDRPWRARRMARLASARFAKAAIRMTSTGVARQQAEAEAKAKDAKARVKMIKRRRAQAKSVKKMAKSAALHTIAASVNRPDAEGQSFAVTSHSPSAGRRLTRPAAGEPVCGSTGTSPSSSTIRRA